jgi:hypothetical protein
MQACARELWSHVWNQFPFNQWCLCECVVTVSMWSTTSDYLGFSWCLNNGETASVWLLWVCIELIWIYLIQSWFKDRLRTFVFTLLFALGALSKFSVTCMEKCVPIFGGCKFALYLMESAIFRGLCELFITSRWIKCFRFTCIGLSLDATSVACLIGPSFVAIRFHTSACLGSIMWSIMCGWIYFWFRTFLFIIVLCSMGSIGILDRIERMADGFRHEAWSSLRYVPSSSLP